MRRNLCVVLEQRLEREKGLLGQRGVLLVVPEPAQVLGGPRVELLARPGTFCLKYQSK